MNLKYLLSLKGELATRNRHRQSRTAFTLIELLVMVAVVAVWATMLVPARARIRPTNQTFQCANNLKQLIAAWQLYADDNNGRLVMNFQSGYLPAAGDAPWASGWLDWTTSRDNTNVQFLVDDRYGKLAKYFNQDTNVFKCPADNYLAAAQRTRNWTQRVRSYSANLGVGDGNGQSGPWPPIYRQVKKTSEFLNPGPGDTFVFLDEHPDSLNDPGFFSPNNASWIDVPATYHNGAGNFAFADGHTEIHKWTASMTQVKGVIYSFKSPSAHTGDPDLHWMSYHAQRLSPASY